jgi:GNAT superfamily N-acetyltransferase
MIAVDPGAQGQGAGTALAGVATGWLRQPGMLRTGHGTLLSLVRGGTGAPESLGSCRAASYV